MLEALFALAFIGLVICFLFSIAGAFAGLVAIGAFTWVLLWAFTDEPPQRDNYEVKSREYIQTQER